jgi:dethiobiotin synthetase
VRRHRIILVSGTDTDVGKTLLTALLLCHLRRRGTHALAIKPFCSGSLKDVEILRAGQDHELAIDEICPFFFSEPVAPLVAARLHRVRVSLSPVVSHIYRIARRCECLLVEGAGGVLAPLGDGYSARELAGELRSEVILVSANKLGTINHTRLSVESMRSVPLKRVKVVMMDPRRMDPSASFNAKILSELLRPVRVHSVPFLGQNCLLLAAVKKNEKKIKKTLASILD